jgi:membrane protease YdiL (CAAX protease family)
VKKTAALGWALGAGLVAFGVTRALGNLHADFVTLGFSRAVVWLVAAALVLRSHGKDRSLSSAIGLRPTQKGLTWLALGLGAVLVIPYAELVALVDARFPPSELVLIGRALATRPDRPNSLFLMVVASVCVLPLAEEVLFRGALFAPLLRAASPGVAAAATAIAYSLASFDPRSMPALLLLGALVGLTRAASGSLIPGVAMHVTFAATWMFARVTGVADLTGKLSLAPVARIMAWLIAGVFAYAVIWVAQNSEEAERARAEDAS